MGTTQDKMGSAMAWSVSARTGRLLMGMVSSVVVVRSLGDHDYGVLSVVRTILMFVLVIAGAGTGQALLKFLPTLRVSGSPGAARTLVRRVLFIHATMWLVMVGLAYAGRGVIDTTFGFDRIGTIVAAALVLFVFEMFFSLLGNVLNASYDTKLLSMAQLASHAVYVVLLLVFLPRGWGVLGVISAAAGGNLLACVILAPRLRYALPAGEGGKEDGIGGARLARFSIPFALVGALNVIVWRQSETFFLAMFRTASEAGYFDLAYRIPQLMLDFVPGTVWPLVMAGFSEVYQKDAGELRVAVDRYYRMLFILCAPICLSGVVLGGRMIEVLFTAEMAPSAVPAQVFFAVFTASFFGTPLSMALYVMEKTHINLIVFTCLAAVNVGLDLVLIPRYGVAGAIIPVAIVIVASPVVFRVIVGRFVDGVRVPLRFIMKCFLGSSPVLLLIPALGWIDGIVELAVAVGAALVAITAGFKVARVLGEEELRMLQSVPLPLAGRLVKFLGS